MAALQRSVVAGTYPMVPTGNLALTEPGPSFRPEPNLIMYMKRKVLYRDLPSLERLAIPPGDPSLTTAVTALTGHQLKLS
eukprot:jgi/Psemu1/55002/gm1.55002_g